MGAPDIVHGRLADTLALRHGPTTPVRHPRRFGVQGCIHDSGDLVDCIGGLSSATRFAIATLESPEAAARTMRQRKATCWGVPCAAVHCWSFSSSKYLNNGI